jgi:hypothetical protein
VAYKNTFWGSSTTGCARRSEKARPGQRWTAAPPRSSATTTSCSRTPAVSSCYSAPSPSRTSWARGRPRLATPGTCSSPTSSGCSARRSPCCRSSPGGSPDSRPPAPLCRGRCATTCSAASDGSPQGHGGRSPVGSVHHLGSYRCVVLHAVASCNFIACLVPTCFLRAVISDV